MCHGIVSSASNDTKFSFEDENRPYLGDLYEEQQLIQVLQKRGRKLRINAIVLSTCHSEKLGKIFHRYIRPVPAIIAINT